MFSKVLHYTSRQIRVNAQQTCSQVLTVRVQVQVLASQVQVQVLNLRVQVQVRDSMSQPVFLVISKNFQL